MHSCIASLPVFGMFTPICCYLRSEIIEADRLFVQMCLYLVDERIRVYEVQKEDDDARRRKR